MLLSSDHSFIRIQSVKKMDIQDVYRMDKHFADVMKNFLIGIKESAREHDMAAISANTDKALKGLQQMTRIRTQYVERLVDSLEHKHCLEKNDLRLQNVQLFNETMVFQLQKFDREMGQLMKSSRERKTDGEDRRVPDCAVCLRTFDSQVIPYSGTCGHSVCEDCSRSLLAGDCPICREYCSFAHCSRNYLAQELIENMSTNQEEAADEDGHDGYETASEENGDDSDSEESEERELDDYDVVDDSDGEEGVVPHYFLPDIFD